MLDIGFSELLLIGIIAIIFLGPEKLPNALVQAAKFLKSIKKYMSDAKDTLEKEINLTEIKQEVTNYKESVTKETNELKANFKFESLDQEVKKDNIQNQNNTQKVG